MSINIIKQFCCVGILIALSSCTNLDFSNHTVHQGNLSVNSSAKKLKIGMNKHNVARIMGTSLISPMFRSDRWDYALTTQKPRQEVNVQSVSLWFKNGSLAKIKRA